MVNFNRLNQRFLSCEIIFPGIRFVRGNFVFGALNKFLGVNDENVEAYSQENVKISETWTAEQIELDSTETAFARMTFDKKVAKGMCDKPLPIIYCIITNK